MMQKRRIGCRRRDAEEMDVVPMRCRRAAEETDGVQKRCRRDAEEMQ
jgi:hypothetical protein